MRKVILFSGIFALVVMALSVMKDGVFREYRYYQRAYRQKLIALAESDAEKAVAKSYGIKLRQLVLPDLNRTDRCISCHVAIEDPRMAKGKNPLKTHPAGYLAKHDINKLGCTICHDGQGLATTSVDAHANTIRFWEKIRMKGDLVQANCLRCHHVESIPDATTVSLGHKLFMQNGCLGCHKKGQVGGFIGPDLDLIGDASFHMKSPAKRNQKELLGKFNHNVNLAYLFESVKFPSLQPDQSKMVDNQFSDKEAYALAVYLKSFQAMVVPDALQDFDKHVVLPDGRDLYLAYCAACHGKDGQGAELKEIDKVGPSLAGEKFQAVAESSFVRKMISDSGSSVMPAWGRSGGLSPAHIDLITDYVMSMRKDSPVGDSDYQGRPGPGRVRFATLCAGCHGIDGEYEQDLIGPSLDSPQFLTYASREFLRTTIVEGRKGTAMPAWYFLKDKAVKDIVAYLSDKRGPPPAFAAVRKAMSKEGAAIKGHERFISRCGSCHGFDAEGRIGPSLRSPEFQALASDQFIYETVIEGRRSTAMGAWSHLSGDELGSIMAYLRTFPSGQVRASAKKAVASEKAGKRSFERICAQCHGEKGRGLIGPAIGGKDFLRSVSDQFLRETISYGRSGTAMRSNLKGTPGVVSMEAEEIEELIAYMRVLESENVDASGQDVTQGDISLGRQVFARSCSQCHGPYGGGDSGPAIGMAGFLATVSDGFIEGTVANGRTGTEMRGFSPGHGALSELSGHELRSVVAYLRSSADADKIKPKVVHGTPLRGKSLFNRQCAQCHGDADRGSFAPRLLGSKFLSAASDSYLQATMSMGHGSQMRSMIRGGGGVVEMTSEDINDIIAYLREAYNKE